MLRKTTSAAKTPNVRNPSRTEDVSAVSTRRPSSLATSGIMPAGYRVFKTIAEKDNATSHRPDFVNLAAHLRRTAGITKANSNIVWKLARSVVWPGSKE
jgi:butyrate kinase